MGMDFRSLSAAGKNYPSPSPPSPALSRVMSDLPLHFKHKAIARRPERGKRERERGNFSAGHYHFCPAKPSLVDVQDDGGRRTIPLLFIFCAACCCIHKVGPRGDESGKQPAAFSFSLDPNRFLMLTSGKSSDTNVYKARRGMMNRGKERKGRKRLGRLKASSKSSAQNWAFLLLLSSSSGIHCMAQRHQSSRRSQGLRLEEKERRRKRPITTQEEHGKSIEAGAAETMSSRSRGNTRPSSLLLAAFIKGQGKRSPSL